MTFLERLSPISIKINEYTGGKRGHSLCARFYSNKLRGVWHGEILVYTTDALFYVFEDEHCRRSWLAAMIRKGETR